MADNNLKLLGTIGFNLSKLENDTKKMAELCDKIDKRAKELGTTFETIAKRIKVAFNSLPFKQFAQDIERLDRLATKFDANQKAINSMQKQSDSQNKLLQTLSQRQDFHNQKIFQKEEKFQLKMKQAVTNFDNKLTNDKDLFNKRIEQMEEKHQLKMTQIQEKGMRRNALGQSTLQHSVMKNSATNLLSSSGRGDVTRKFQDITSYAFDASLIYGAVAGVQNLISALKEVNTQEIELKRILEQSNIPMGKMVDKSFEIAKQSGITVTEIMKIQNLWARAGDYQADAINKLSKATAVGMNVAGFENAEQSVTYLNSALNQLNLNYKDAEKVLDSWVKIADKTAIKSTKDLADSLMRWGVQAKDFGMTYHEVNAVTALLASRTAKSGEEIGTAMKTIMSYFKDEKTVKTLEKYGVHIKKNAYEYNNFVKIMADLNAQYVRMKNEGNQTGLQEISNALGRIRRVADVKALIEGWGDFDKFMKVSLSSQGYAIKENEKLMTSLERQLNNLKTSAIEFATQIGNAGLLEQLEYWMKNIEGAFKWFNGLDAVTKKTALVLTEMVVGLALVNKAIALAFGGSSIKVIQFMIAKFAVFTQSQWALNVALKIGAGEMLTNTEATVSNGVAKERLAMINQILNTGMSMTDKQLAIENIILAENTAMTQANVMAKRELIVASEGSALAMAEGATMGGLVGGALAMLTNPLTWIGLLLGGLYIKWQQHKAEVEENIRVMNEFKEKAQELKSIENTGVVQEGEVDDLRKRVNELRNARDEYEKLNKKKLEFEKKPKQVAIGVGDSPYQVIKSKAEQDNIKKWEEARKKLQDLGVTANDVGGHIDELTKVLNISGDETQRTAKMQSNTIAEYYKGNQEVLKLVDNFKNLKVGTQDYKDAVSRLQASFPDFVNQVDYATGEFEINVQAIKKSIQAHGGLTIAQAETIKSTIHLTQTVKDAMISQQKIEIATTQAKITNTVARIKAIIAEERAYLGMYSGVSDAQSKMYKSSVELGGHLKSAFPTDPSLQKRFEQLNLLPKSNPIVSNLQGQLDKLQTGLKTSEQMLKTIQGLKVFQGGGGHTTPAGGTKDKKKNKSSGSTPEFDLIEAQLEAINKLASQIKTAKDKIDALGDSYEDLVKKAKLWQDVISLETKIQGKLKDANKVLEGQLDKVDRAIGKYVKGWANKTPTQQMEAFNKLTAKNKDKVDDLIKTHKKLSDTIQKNTEDWYGASKAIKDAQSERASLLENGLKKVFDAQKELDEQRLKNRQEQDKELLQKKIFGTSEQEYEKSLKATLDIERSKLEALKSQNDEKERQNALIEKQLQLEKIKNDTRFGYIDETTGKEVYSYDRGAVNSLQAEIDKELEKEAQDKIIADQEKAIADLETNADKLREKYNNELASLDEYQKQEQEALNIYWTKKLTDESIHQEALNLIKQDGFNKSLKSIDTQFKDYQTLWETQNKAMYDVGVSLNDALKSGMSLGIDTWYQQKQQEAYNFGKLIKDGFNNGLGGVSDISSLKLPMPNVSYNKVTPNTSVSTNTTGQTIIQITIDRIEANNLNELLSSIDPYITAMK